MQDVFLPPAHLDMFLISVTESAPPPCEKHFTQSIHLLFLLDPGGLVSFLFFFFHLFHETGVRLQTCMHNKRQSQKTSCLLAPSVGVWSRLRSLLSKRTPRHPGRYISRNKQVTEHVSSVLETDYLIIHFLFHNGFGLLTNLCISPVALFLNTLLTKTFSNQISHRVWQEKIITVSAPS